jgi:hypothetical protein
MTPETHHRLLRQVLTDDKLEAVRQQSLQAMLVSGGCRRRRRSLRRASMIGLLSLMLLSLILTHRPPPRSATARHSSPAPPSLTSKNTNRSHRIEIITDAELFALFPGRSLALVGPPGRQQLVFFDQPTAANAPR